MDFSLTDAQLALTAVASRLFDDARDRQVPAAGAALDRVLWSGLAAANLLGTAIPEVYGGSGLSVLELCLVLECQGRAAVHAPVLETLVMGALPLSRFGSEEQCRRWLPGVVSGDVVLSAALPGQLVPAGDVADALIVADGHSLVLVEAGRAKMTRQVATTGEVVLTLDEVPDGELMSGTPEASVWLEQMTTLALCAQQVGLAEAAVEMTAAYTTERHQFGRPIASFQAVQQRIADAYIDVACMRSTMLLGAWRAGAGLSVDEEVKVAKYWAAEGGHRVVQAAQHLHGGVGVDLAYPLHRYTLWSKMIELALGGASEQLERLGADLAERYTAAARR